MLFWWICGGESVLPVLLLRHLGSSLPSWAILNPKRWCCESATLNMPANLENSAVATGLEKVSFHSNAKECSNYCTIALISHACIVKLKVAQSCLTLCGTMDYTVHGILQARTLEWVAIPFSRGNLPTQGLNPGLPQSNAQNSPIQDSMVCELRT